MNDVMFITHFRPCRSGYASYAFYLINSIRKQRPHAHMIVIGCNEDAGKRSEKVGASNITNLRVWGSKDVMLAPFRIINKVLVYRPSKIYVYYPLFTTYSNLFLNLSANLMLLFMLLFSASLLGVRVIVDLDNAPKWRAPFKSKVYFLLLFSPLSFLFFFRDKITMVCRNSIMKRLVVNYFKVRAIFIPHGCPSPNTISTEESISTKRVFGLIGRKVVLYLGYVSRYKGIDYLIKAFARLRSNFPAAVLLIAGDYFNQIDKYELKKHRYLPTLRKLVEDLGLSDSIIFHTFRVPDEQLRSYFAIADIVCLPYVTSSISFSGVFALAMSYGKPLVVSDCGWFDDVITNGETGLIVPEKDVEALANALSFLLRDDEIRLKISANIFSKAQKLSWENVARLWRKLLEC